MRYLAILLSCILLICANDCNAQKKQKRAQLRQQHELKVKKCIAKDSLFIEIKRVNQMDDNPQITSHGYYLSLINSKASLYVPYIGKITTAIFDTGKLSIEAKDQQVKITKGDDTENECTYYLFYFKDDARKDKWECVFQLYYDGHAIIKFSCPGRDDVGFHGKLKVD
jgi:hypothetical protein